MQRAALGSGQPGGRRYPEALVIEGVRRVTGGRRRGADDAGLLEATQGGAHAHARELRDRTQRIERRRLARRRHDLGELALVGPQPRESTRLRIARVRDVRRRELATDELGEVRAPRREVRGCHEARGGHSWCELGHQREQLVLRHRCERYDLDLAVSRQAIDQRARPYGQLLGSMHREGRDDGDGAVDLLDEERE